MNTLRLLERSFLQSSSPTGRQAYAHPYEQMVCITIEPDWAKLLDFETTIPQAVEDLVRAYQAR